MTPLAATDRIFFERADAELDRAGAERHVATALANADDGELFLEYRESESISLDDGHIRSAGFDTTLGFGLRAVAGEATGFAHAGELSDAALGRAAASVGAIASGHSGVASEPPRATNSRACSSGAGCGARPVNCSGRSRPRTSLRKCCCSCKRCFGFATAATLFLRTAAARACSTRLAVAPRRAWD